MIELNDSTVKLIYKTLRNLDKIPKVSEVDSNIKELVRAELNLIKYNTILDRPYYKYDKLNITDKLIDCYIGKILKRMRKELYLYEAILKRTKIPNNKIKTSILYYYNLPNGTEQLISTEQLNRRRGIYSNWEPIRIQDQIKRDFVKLLMSDKHISVESARENILENYSKFNREVLEDYTKMYFK